jgi:asparagine synthase (glutamine-hydrolysing)
MCGIAGFVDRAVVSRSADLAAQQRLHTMLQAIRHRGPDDWGMMFFGFPGETAESKHVSYRQSPCAHLALGHRRLSILDLSQSGRQPMTSADGALTITFNGEIYNYVELREELSREVIFRTRTDTEVLLEAYRRWGIGMLERLDGMFAFALWDARAGKLICARDPLGIKPFYYAECQERFLFASEPRGVLVGLGSPGHVDAARVAEFLVLGVSDHDEGTPYREVRQLRGGHWFEVGGDGAVSEPRAYWQPRLDRIDDEDVPVRVRAQVQLAVQRQLRADVPVGSCLSGGLDSASIVATAGSLLGQGAAGFRALTLSNQGFEGDETAMAQLTIQRAGVCPVLVEAQPGRIVDDLKHLICAMDQPFSGLSVLGGFKVMQQARAQGLKVMLDGQGGDEVFLGYPRVAQRVIAEYFRQGRLPTALHEWSALRRNASQPLLTSLLGNLFFGSPCLARWRNSRRIRGLIDPTLLEQVRPEVAADIFAGKDIAGLQMDELTRYILPRLLRYEDRNSMAFGLEARVPLLAVGLVEMALRLPLCWKIRDGWTKYALRMAMSDRLPKEILWQRRKRGFEVPQRRWVEAARPAIGEWLSDLSADCPVNASELLARIDSGQSGTQWFWRCLSVALWMRFSGVRV